MNEVIDSRFARAREFLMILEFALKASRSEFYSEAATHSNWLYRLAAIHPKHYSEFAPLTGSSCPVRGPRSMPIDAGVRSAGCCCHVIWGYPCHFEHPMLAADHLFPFSFGGPSSGANKIFLCSLHNQSKGSDIHLYPWELGEPQWLSPLFQRVERILGKTCSREARS